MSPNCSGLSFSVSGKSNRPKAAQLHKTARQSPAGNSVTWHCHRLLLAIEEPRPPPSGRIFASAMGPVLAMSAIASFVVYESESSAGHRSASFNPRRCRHSLFPFSELTLLFILSKFLQIPLGIGFDLYCPTAPQRRCQSVHSVGFGIPTLESGNNPGTLRVPLRSLTCFCMPSNARKCLKFQIKVLCHGRGREFESRRPRHSFQRSYRT